jgi:hypothetical protein
MKLGAIIRFGGWLGGAAFAVVLGLLAWSLKANYENLDAVHQQTAALPAAAATAADRASTETVLKLGATNATATPQD